MSRRARASANVWTKRNASKSSAEKIINRRGEGGTASEGRCGCCVVIIVATVAVRECGEAASWRRNEWIRMSVGRVG